ncbi:hypothetical protein MCC93_02330 [Morococcus cerebrosus]|uniref:Uncharacterized protein n=1 Tax=Morococcus cerebrosus TaxID=1056807 RepID=A0A0C1EV37_9NEIS|nr:hypothetical protein MCC93_02330 [Morococcus cerebrosus]KJJ18750.1 hypothetical protein HMPREF3156_00939 [Neisseria sp. HMSC06F02]
MRQLFKLNEISNKAKAKSPYSVCKPQKLKGRLKTQIGFQTTF